MQQHSSALIKCTNVAAFASKMNLSAMIIISANNVSITLSEQSNVTVSPTISVGLSAIPPPSLLSIILGSFFLIQSIFVIFLNGFAVITILMNPKMQTQVNKVILSLLLADLLLGAFVPFHASFLLVPSLSLNRYTCVIRTSVSYFLCLASACSLMLITLNRYVAIIYPYHYSNHGSLPRLNLFIAGIWIYSLGYGVAVILWHRWPVVCNPETVMPPGIITMN